MGGRHNLAKLAAALLVILAGCGGGPAVQVIPPGPAPAQQGIRLAVVRGTSGAPAGVRVTWTRVDDTDVQGYYIYRDTETIPSGDPTGHDALRVNDGELIPQSGSGSDILSFDDIFTPAVGEEFFYRMTVVNQTDDESDFSNEESITIAEHSIDTVTQAGGSIGDTVTITGTHFGASRDGDIVYFTGADGETDVACASGDYISWSATEIEVKIPYGAADGVVGVSISDTTVLSIDEIAYNEPVLDTVDPTEDWVAHDYVTLTGTDFGPSPDDGGTETIVYFDGAAAQTSDYDQSAWSTTQIKVKVPAAATGMTVDVMVSVAGNDSGTQSFLILPHVDSVNPTSGVTGTSTTVTGTNFGSSQGSGTVRVKGFLATVSTWSNTSITFTIPGNATDGNVTVMRSDTESSSIGFDVVPAISSLSNLRREPGQNLTINGSGFGNTQNNSKVTFIGGTDVDASNYISWSATQIVVEVPAGSKTGQVQVSIDDTSVGSNQDTATSDDTLAVLLPPPVIDGTGQV